MTRSLLLRYFALILAISACSLTSLDVEAQYFTPAQCSGTPTGGLGTNTYGPFYSVSTANATSRVAVVYPSSQLAGISGGQITNLYFHKFTSGSMGGSPTVNIYLKEMAAGDFGSGSLTWANEIATATQVYSGNPASLIPSTVGWVNFPLATTFTYSGTQNLVVLLEYVNTGASSSITWTYEYTSPCISTSNSNTTKYVNNTTGVAGTTLSSSNYRRPYIGFDIVLAPCVAPTTQPTALILTTPAAASANGSFTAASTGADKYLVVRTPGTAALNTLPVNGTTYTANSTLGNGTIVSYSNATTFNNILLATNTQYTYTIFSANDQCSGGPSYFTSTPLTGSVTTTALANDDCSGAIALTQSATCTNTAGSTQGATLSMAAAPCNGNPDDDVWFKFVATNTDAQIELSSIVAAVGTSVDAYFQVLDGGVSGVCPSTFTSLMCSDPNTGIVGGLTVGNTYFIRVYTYPVNPAAISFNICVKDVAAVTACATLSSPANNTSVSTAPPVLSWSSATNAASYDIYLDGTNPPTTLIATVHNNSTTSYTLPAGLPVGDYYWYVVPKSSLGAPTTCASNARKFTVVAPPANDNCAGATPLSQGATCVNTPSSTLGATLSMAAAPCNGNPDDDVWFSFVATNTDAVVELSGIVAAVGTSVDAYFQVLDGGVAGACSTTMPSVVCSDPNSATIGGMTIGNTYFIRVYTYGASPGAAINFNICVRDVSTAPTACATQNNPGVDNSVSATPTLAWSTVTNASAYDIYLDGSNPPTTIVGTTAALNYTITTPLAAGDYYWYIAPKNSIGGPSTCASNTRKFTVVGAPANDNCANAIVLSHTSAVSGTAGTTLGATQSIAAAPCNGNPDDDVWYKFVATHTSAQIDLLNVATSTTTNTSVDAYFQVLDGGTSGACSTSLPSLLCSDPNTGTVSGLTVGNTYFVRVYTYALSASINYDISISGAPLSIKLGNITANNAGSSNQITWNTLAEEQTDDFELERSINGTEFIKIYGKEARGYASTYTYFDENPVNGVNYYRLKMIDANGAAQYSKIVKAIVGGKEDFVVRAYPNPVIDNKLTVEVTGIITQNAVITITDVTGKFVRTLNVINSKTDIDMSKLTSGIYFVKYMDAEQSHTMKVTK